MLSSKFEENFPPFYTLECYFFIVKEIALHIWERVLTKDYKKQKAKNITFAEN
jgi:hypothetical protein